jgi:hypothetical protein
MANHAIAVESRERSSDRQSHQEPRSAAAQMQSRQQSAEC